MTLWLNLGQIKRLPKTKWGIVGIYRIRAILTNGSYPACYILRIILVVDFVDILLNHSASTHVACFVVTFGRVAFANTTARRVNKFEGAAGIVGFCHDAHMPNAIATRASVEKHQVAGFQFAAAHTSTIIDLTSGGAVEAVAKLAEHVAGEAGAVESARTRCTVHVGGASE